jgi:hypothetical protein
VGFELALIRDGTLSRSISHAGFVAHRGPHPKNISFSLTRLLSSPMAEQWPYLGPEFVEGVVEYLGYRLIDIPRITTVGGTDA